MTAGVTAGERFRSWADIQANAARGAGGLAALGVREDDSVALMLRNDFATFEVNMAASQLGAYAVPINWHFTPEEAGYILARLRRQGAGGAHRPFGADRPRHSRRREGSGRADARGDRRGLQRAGREAPGAGGHRDLGRLRGAQRTQHPAAQSGARQHDLHIGHDRPAQGRAPPAVVARNAGSHRAGSGALLGTFGRSIDRRADERPDVSFRARGLRHGQRAARPAHRPAAALRRGGHAAADRKAPGQPHAHRADHARAPAAPARRGEAPPRSLVPALDHARRRALRACRQAPDDRMVGSGHQRILRRHRDRHRGLAQFAGGAAEAGHRGTRRRRRHPAHRRRGRARREAGRGGRDLPERPASLGVHLQQRRRQAPRGGAGRPRDGGRRRLPGCRRLHLPVRSQARHDHLGRRQYLPGRNRIGADPDAGRARLRGVRHSRRGVRRADLRLCRAAGRKPRCRPPTSAPISAGTWRATRCRKWSSSAPLCRARIRARSSNASCAPHIGRRWAAASEGTPRGNQCPTTTSPCSASSRTSL